MTSPYIAPKKPQSGADYLNSLKQDLAGSNGSQTNLAPVGSSGSSYLESLKQDLAASGKATSDTHPNDTGFFQSLGNFITGSAHEVGQEFSRELSGDPSQTFRTDALTRDAAKQMMSNVGTSLGKFTNYVTSTPPMQQLSDLKDMGALALHDAKQAATGGQLSSTGLPISIGKSLIQMAQAPINLVTGSVNDQGTARPASPEEQTQSLQQTVGIVAQIGVFKGVKALVLGGVPEGEAALSGMKPNKVLGNIGSLVQGSKYLGAEGLAGGISGGVQGGITGMGQDNQGAQILSSALSFVPVSIAMGLLGVGGYVEDTKINKGKFMEESNETNTHQLAAFNAIRINPSDPMAKLIKGTDALSSSDKMLKAAIDYKLSLNDGYIADDISPEFGKGLQEGTVPSGKVRPMEFNSQSELDNHKNQGLGVRGKPYVAPPELHRDRPRPNSVEVKFDSPLDKLAYMASKKDGPSQHVEEMIQDASNQTGLSRSEIIRHGQYVKQQQLREYKTGSRVPRTQADIDAYNQSSIEEGKAKVIGTPEGGLISDNLKGQWLKKGDVVIEQNPQPGATPRVLPINETNTLQQLGRTSDDSPFYQSYQKLGVQQFTPDFGLDHNPNGPPKFYYSPNTQAMMVSPVELSVPDRKFFENNGVVKKEIVNFMGLDRVVTGADKNGLTLESTTDGSVLKSVPFADVRRTNHSITPEIIKTPKGRGVAGIKPGILNSDELVSQLYKNFKTSFDEAPEGESFAGTLQRFFHDNNIETKDQSNFSTLLTKKLGNDLAKQTLDPEELKQREKLLNQFSDLNEDSQSDHAHKLSNLAMGQNLFFSPEGAGKYRLRWQDTGDTYAIVSNPDEALAAINKQRQVNGLDLDGGYTGVIPTGIANYGGLVQTMIPVSYGKIQQKRDILRVGSVIGKITTPFTVLKAIDNLSARFAVPTNLGPAFLELQRAQIERNNMIARDRNLSSIQKAGQKVLDLGSTLSSKRRLVAADNTDVMTIDQIKQSYLGTRSGNPMELKLANELVKSKDVGAVKDLLMKTRLTNPNASLGSTAFFTTMNQLVVSGKVKPEIAQAAELFASSVAKVGKNMVSGPLILRLADALEDPTKAVDASTHARLNDITSKEQRYIDAIHDWFRQVAPEIGIDPKASTAAQLPSLHRYIIGNQGEATVDPDFAQEMTKVGINPRNELTRDPNQLIAKYWTALLNHKSGINDAIDQFQKTTTDELNKLVGTPMEGNIKGIQEKIDQHVKEIQGYPTVDDQLGKSMGLFAKHLGIPMLNPGSVLSWMSLGTLAGRPVLAMRDFHNVMNQSYIAFGTEFVKEAFNSSISSENIQKLKDQNILPDKQSGSMIDPARNEGELIPGTNRVQRMGDAGFRLSGQEASYEHANTGVYLGSMRMAEKYFGKMQRGEMTKDKAYDKLGISSNYGPGLIKQIDDLVSSGKLDKAADLYSQANMRYVSHIYGYNNNPIGWKSNFGRYLSQWGSYSANATGTFVDQISTGSKLQIARKASRALIAGGATLAVGHALGFNLSSWLVGNPLTVLPTAGPVVSMWQDYGEDVMQGKLPLTGMMLKESQMFIPYGKAAVGWIDALDQIGQGQLLKGIWKAGGGSVLPNKKEE